MPLFAHARVRAAYLQFLFLLLATLFTLFSSIEVRADTLLGTATVQARAESLASGRAAAFRSVAVVSGQVSVLQVYVDAGNAATAVAAGLYSDAGGRPGTLLTQGRLAAPAAGAWNAISVPPASVAAGTSYWIAILGPAGSGPLRYRDGRAGAASETSSQTTLGTLPGTWTTGRRGTSGPLSAYAQSLTNAPILAASPLTLAFNALVGSPNPTPQTVSVANTGTGTLSFSVSTDQPWLSATPAQGTAPSAVQVGAALAGLVPGLYTGHVTIAAPGVQGSPVTITVTLNVAAQQLPTLSVTPVSLSFSTVAGGANPAAQSLALSASGATGLVYGASANQPWITVAPTSGAIPGAVQVGVNASGLAAGTYTGAVTITASGTANTPVTVGVTLTIAASPPPPSLVVSPVSLAFTAIAGGANPAAQLLTIANGGGGTLAFTVSGNQPWLTAAPASGSAPGSVQVSIDSAALAAGTYTGQLTVTASGALGSPSTVPVTLTVEAAGSFPLDWPTIGQNPQRSGFAANDGVISKANVAQLALSWTVNVDGKVVAQPLYASGVTMGANARDILVVATTGNSVYALDAVTGAQIWRQNLGPVVSGGWAIPGGNGIRSAPVIDRNRGRVFVVADGGTLNTLSLVDGSAQAAALQIVDFPLTNVVRGGLNLVGNSLYIANGSDGSDSKPWRGRIWRVDVSGAAPVIAQVFDVIPGIAGDNRGGGIWGYGGVSVDPATGNVYAATGGDANGGYTPYGTRLLALTPTLSLIGSYEPPHPTSFACTGAPCDVDFGATPAVFQPTGCPLMVAAGNKNGGLYVMRATDFAAGTAFQSLNVNTANDALASGGLGGIPAWWPAGNMLFVTDSGAGIPGVAGGVIGLTVSAPPLCQLQVAWSHQLPDLGVNQSSPIVGGDLVFMGEGAGGVVHAFDARTGTEVWNTGAIVQGSTQAAPIVAGGRLFVASWSGRTSADFGVVRAFAVATATPILAVTPASVSFSAVVGGANPAGVGLTVTNAGTGGIAFTAAGSQPWLSVTPATGSAPGVVQVGATIAGLATGTYTGQVTITAGGAQGSPKVIPVTLTVSATPPPPGLVVSPTSLTFSATAGGANPAAKSLSVSEAAGSALAFTAASSQPWLSVGPVAGTTPAALQVGASVVGLAAGTYTGQITVTASGAQGSPAAVPVSFTVAPASGCTGTAPPILFGAQSVLTQADSNGAGSAEAFAVTAAGCGNVSTVSVYVDTGNAATRMVVGLYTDNGGHPGTLLGQGITAGAPVAGAWNAVTITPVAVTQNTRYWVALLGTGGTLTFRDTHGGGCNSETSSTLGLTTLPATWSTGTVFTDCPLSAFGTP